MKTLNTEESKPLVDLVVMIEKIVLSRNFEREQHQDEIEKHFNFIMQGEDHINPYERRLANIDDLIWHEVIKKALTFLNLRASYDKMFEN